VKKTIALIVLICISALCFGQKIDNSQRDYPLVVSHYDLELSFNFKEGILNGICDVKIENKSDSLITEIPFLLYRLMKVTSVQDQQGQGLNFIQSVVSFNDFEKLQVNSIIIDENIEPHNCKTLRIHYNGYLLGYQETGMKYIKDKISPEFTIIRNDAYSYPVLSKPSFSFLIRNVASNNFSYKLNVTVPDSLVVANGGRLLSRKTENGVSNYKYESKKNNWRIDIAISSYKYESTERLDIFYFPDDLTSARALLAHGNETIQLYTQWWGKLKNDNSITLIETEKQSGGQADETAILLPQESFNANDYTQLYHELSHLWNVKIVEKEGLSPRWEEGLATFIQYLVEEYYNPEKKGMIDKASNGTLRKLKRNFNSDLEMFHIPMCEYGNRGKSNYSYDQGLVMFAVLYKWLGQEKFNLAIRSFYEKYHNSGATTKDFTNLWEKTLKIKGLEEFFNDWVYTTNYTTFIKNDNTIDEIVKHYAHLSEFVVNSTLTDD